MNVLFLTLGNVTDLSANEIYPDLLRELHSKQHNVYVACGRERRSELPTEECEELGIHVLRVRIGNITKTNLIEKGISTLTVERCFRNAIDQYWKGVRFDLIAYSTPPITFCGLIRYLKKRDHAKTYLMLKDIFPQNAVDLGMFGTRSPIYRYFRSQERSLYRVSDYIGCMSLANVRYVIEHNPGVDPAKVEVCPNALEIQPPLSVDAAALKEKFGIPKDRPVFLFGGNLGKPQGIDHLLACLRSVKSREDLFFVIAGSGTEFDLIKQTIEKEQLSNVRLFERMNSADYNALTAACDVGMIFLDHRFTIPNFPSRILPYMQEEKPIFACTDTASDLKDAIAEGQFGWWCPSDDVSAFESTVKHILAENNERTAFGKNSRRYLETHYDVKDCADRLISHMASRTLIVSQCFYPSVNRGGPAVSVTNLAKHLSSKTQVSVLTAAYESGSNALYEEVQPGKNRLFDCDVYYETGTGAKDLTSRIEQIAPDTLYISSLFSAEYTLPALRYAKKTHLRTVLAPRGELKDAALSRKKAKKLPYLAYLKLFGLTKNICFHATSDEEAESIRKHFKKAKIVTAQNIPTELDIRQRTRNKESGELRAVSVCRIHPIKGLDIAIQALADVKERVTFDIYGPTEDESYHWQCLTLAKKLPVNINVNFHGAAKPEDLPGLLADADVFVLPTKTENFGNAIVEALSAGCPVVISDGTTPWQELNENNAGVNADAVTDYTEAFRIFAAMTEAQRKTYSEGAKTYIRERLHMEETCAAYDQMFGGI